MVSMAISFSFHDPHFYSLSISGFMFLLSQRLLKKGHEKKPAAGVDINLHEEVDLVVEHGKPVNDHNTLNLNFPDTVVPGMPEFDRKLGAPTKRMAPLVTLQKKVYMSILRRELPKLLALSSGTCSHQSLENIVIQLRKAGSHPHLFAGIEPEPYEEGEHLASGKLVVLDQLDYMELRKYPYERLDGSIRVEERFATIQSFSRKSGIGNSNSEADSDSAFVFMISSRAGGVGLNLVAADTVSFAILTSMEQGV
uniref:Helicase C-terminal domain-containing protein n=1 Tax=Lactuca sativa TaxID=4236 RepID=A0A9R1W5V7_LACSA|nr:hypothetical protein LSAT_V11C300106060 [Lactuca sativa]